MRYLTFIALLLLANLCTGQDLSGKWFGEMPRTAASRRYTITMQINQKGDSLSGVARYQSDEYWVEHNFKGIVKDTEITFREYSTNGCNCSNGTLFCLKLMIGKLSLDSTKTYPYISGEWTSNRYFDGKNYIDGLCAPGTFNITKSTPLPPAKPIVTTVSLPPQPVIKTTATPQPTTKETVSARRSLTVKTPKDSIKAFERPLDGYVKRTMVKTSAITGYAPLREADAGYLKRIWRDIDLREKFNTYLASPKARLIDVIMDGIESGEILAYDANPTIDDVGGDAFSKPLNPAEAFARLADSTLVTKRDANNEILSSKLEATAFNPDSIVRFRIKEDWIFDKQRSEFHPRIVGIAPMFKPKSASGNIDYIPAFWIYFPEARKFFAKRAIVNNFNDATGLSFDDAFLKRLFNGYIVKQSNNKDERIRDYKDGIDRLYEGRRVGKALMDWELDLWAY